MSFLLDTNVVSELRKARCNENVRGWVAGADRDQLYLSVITAGELRAGAELLRGRDPQQAEVLDLWLTAIVDGFGKRVLPVDMAIAERWGRLNGSVGPLSPTDGLLAATAAEHELTVVTRNVKHFDRVGVPVLNPWVDPAN